MLGTSIVNKSPRILIADDEADIRALLAERIRDAFPDAKIAEADNGTEAINKISLQKFDLLITDIRMPRRDGMGVLSAMANMLDTALKPDHVMVISGQSQPAQYPKNIGRVTFFPKPIDFQRFDQHLQSLFSKSSAHAEVNKISGVAPGKIDVEFISPFIEATLRILQTNANVNARKEKVFLRTQGQISGDISAMIAMNSQKYLGSMAITFPSTTFLAIVSNMLGEKYVEITPEIQDAAAEICNQIFGMAKTSLNKIGHTIQPAIPSVIVGQDHSIGHTATGPCLVVQFQSDVGPFMIETVTQPT